MSTEYYFSKWDLLNSMFNSYSLLVSSLSNRSPNTPNSTGNPRKSIVWNFLEDIGSQPKSTIKICKLCRASINTSYNTSNARTHLKAKHPLEFAKAEKKSDVDSVTTSDCDTDSDFNISTSIQIQADGVDDVSSTSTNRPSARSNLGAGTNEEMVRI